MKFLNQKFLIYLTLAAAPLYLVKFSLGSLSTNLLELLILLNLLVWFFQKPKLSFKKNWSDMPWQIKSSLGLILLGLVISIFSNNAILIGLGILKGWFLLPLFFAYLFFENTKNTAQIEQSLFGLYCSAFLVALVSLGYKVLGLVTFDGRLSAFYASPNYLAFYLAPGVLLGSYLAVKTVLTTESFLKKLSLLASFGLLLLALFYTYSYGAWLAVFLALAAVSFFAFPKKQFFLTLSLLLGFLVVATFSQIHSQKFAGLTTFSKRSSLASRFVIWQAAEKMLLKNPIWGIGPGNFQANYLALQPFFPPYLEWAVPEPHNLFLAFWLQAGILGLVGFIFLLVFIFFWLLKNQVRGKITVETVLGAFFLYTILHGLVDTPFWKNDLAFLFWVFLSIFMANLKNKQKNTSL
jgi:O-antigen ligase